MNESGDGKFRQLLANPWVGGTGLALTSISIIVAVYFGVRSAAKRELILTQEKPSILVFDPGVTDAFDLTPKSLLWSRSGIDPLSEKVHGVSFAIWNDGRLSIRPEHILRVLRIQIGSGRKQPVAIWGVRSSFWSREEIALKPSTHVEEENGFPQIPIGFRILEQNDGGSFQVIYSGPEDIQISLKGTVEGIARNIFFPKRKINWYLLGTFILFLMMTGSMIATMIIDRRWTVSGITMMLAVLFIVVFYGISQRSKMVELADIPKFDYRPSIEDLRPE